MYTESTIYIIIMKLLFVICYVCLITDYQNKDDTIHIVNGCLLLITTLCKTEIDLGKYYLEFFFI